MSKLPDDYCMPTSEATHANITAKFETVMDLYTRDVVNVFYKFFYHGVECGLDLINTEADKIVGGGDEDE
jgi:hypothetical protein